MPGPTAANLLLDGKRSVTVLGNGKQRVAPVFLGDVVAAIFAAMLGLFAVMPLLVARR